MYMYLQIMLCSAHIHVPLCLLVFFLESAVQALPTPSCLNDLGTPIPCTSGTIHIWRQQNFRTFWTPPSSLSARSILFVCKFKVFPWVFPDPPFPVLCKRHIWMAPQTTQEKPISRGLTCQTATNTFRATGPSANPSRCSLACYLTQFTQGDSIITDMTTVPNKCCKKS